MRKWYVLVAVLASVIIVGSVSAASSDQGRRLAGPFCIGKRFLQPVQRGNQTTTPAVQLAILRAGVVRSVSQTEKCRPWENRKDGVAVSGPAGPQGPKGDPGPQGGTGGTGATGAAGVQGLKGEIGAKGDKGLTGERGPKGYKGDAGAKGDKGDRGYQGIQGVPGKDGKDGKDGAGIGDGTRWICVHGKPLDEPKNYSPANFKTLGDDDFNGGPLFDGGTGTNPDCKGGAKFAFKVVTSGDIVAFDK